MNDLFVNIAFTFCLLTLGFLAIGFATLNNDKAQKIIGIICAFLISLMVLCFIISIWI